MPRFRYHRGLLLDSLSTEIKVESLKDIAKDIGFPDAKLHCEFYCNDPRALGYKDTYIVTGERWGEVVVIGFSDTLLK